MYYAATQLAVAGNNIYTMAVWDLMELSAQLTQVR